MVHDKQKLVLHAHHTPPSNKIPPLQQPSYFDSLPHLSANALECNIVIILPSFSNTRAPEEVIVGESIDATTSTDNKDESAIVDIRE